jgi:hypothetical protein
MRWQKIGILLVPLLAAVLVGGVASAQTGDGFDLSWHVMGGGGAGGPVTGSGFSVRSTIGQTATGSFSDAVYWFRNGYWGGVINTPPVLTGLPDVIVDHTTVLPVCLDLWAYAVDKESLDGNLTYSIVGSPPAGAGVSIVGNRWLCMDPSTDWCPSTAVTIRATDPGGLWDNDAFTLSVTWSCKG